MGEGYQMAGSLILQITTYSLSNNINSKSDVTQYVIIV